MFELTVSLGSILTIAAFLVGGLAFVYTIKADTRIHETRFEMLAEQLGDVKSELKKLGEVLVTLAVQDGKIKTMQEQQLLQGKRLDETATRLNSYIDANVFARLRAVEEGREDGGR